MRTNGMQLSVANEILLEEVRRLLLEGKEVILMTKGGSMLPFIVGERDSVLLVHREGDIYRKGDVVLAEVEKERYVLHRVLALDGGRLVLRGDGNLTACEHCTPDDVLGRAVEIIGPSGKRRRIGRARLWQSLCPFARRCVLGLYRRTVLKIITER